VGWYINHSTDPNVKQNKSGSYTTLRKIKKGEELTADYLSYSEEPPRKWHKK
jgi:SET domain-containing protein